MKISIKSSDKFIYRGQECNSTSIKADLIEKTVLKDLQNVINNLDSLNLINTEKIK